MHNSCYYKLYHNMTKAEIPMNFKLFFSASYMLVFFTQICIMSCSIGIVDSILHLLEFSVYLFDIQLSI